jgi:hypothetical protein
MCLLLLEQSQSYEIPSITDQFSSCIHSMRVRYLKRIFIVGIENFKLVSLIEILSFLGQWLPTLSKIQLNDIQLNYERYVCGFDLIEIILLF